MRKSVSIGRAALWTLLAGGIGLVGCDSGTNNNNNNNDAGTKDYQKDCVGCRMDGQTCTFKVNCPGGSICNVVTDELYDSTKETGICIHVSCETTNDCTDGKVCSLKKECEAPFCQVDQDCPGKACIGGKCEDAPAASSAASCAILTKKGSIRQGATQSLEAVAKNQNGAVLAGIQFDWSSDQSGRVSVAGNTATGGGEAGQAVVSAKVKGNAAVSCTGSVQLTNFPTLGANDARIVVVSGAGTGPVANATVYLTSGGNTTEQQTGADGSTVFAGVGAVDQVTVKADNFEYVSVLAPGVKDIFVPLPAISDKTKAGGFRGSVDISTTRDAEIQLGIAGPALPPNLLDFDLASLLGDSIPTTINAKELGLENRTVPLPGGVMLALGASRFTDDSAASKERCVDQGPSADELGCYVARAPAGPGAAWALAGQLKLTAVAKLAGTLSSAFGGGNVDLSKLPIGDILTSVLPLFQKLQHGITTGLDIQEFAKTGDCSNPEGEDFDTRCKADFSKYQKIDLAADQKLSILSAVTVPSLPEVPGSSPKKYATGAIVIGGALSTAGIIPLGLGAGLDIVKKDETADGRVDGAEAPFGENSTDLDPNQVPLAMAPPHSGAEGSKLALVAIALDIQGLTSGSGIQLTGLVNFPEDKKIDGQEAFSGDFVPFPAGEFASGAGTWTPSSNSNVTVTRLEVQGAGKTWLVYAKGGGNVTLPDFNGSPKAEVVGGLSDMFVQQVRANTTFENIWQFGSGTNLDHAIELIQGFVIQQCSQAAGSICQVK